MATVSGCQVSHASHCTDGLSSHTAASASAHHALCRQVAGEQVDRHGSQGEGGVLQEDQQLRPTAEPVQRGEREVGDA